METLTSLLTVAAPIVVSALTEAIKKLPVIDSASKPNKALVIRTIAAVLALGAGIATFTLTGVIDSTLVQVAVGAAAGCITWVATQVPYWFGRKQKEQVAQG